MPSRKLLFAFTLFAAAAAPLAISHQAAAQTVGTSVLTLTLDDPAVSGTPGQDLLFTGVLTNTPTDASDIGEILTLADDSYSVSPPADIVDVDDSPYSVSGPGGDYANSIFGLGTADTLAPGASEDIPLFYVDLPTTASPGDTVSGEFAVNYLDSSGNYNLGGAQNFSVNVASATITSVPEPSGATLILVGFGVMLLYGAKSCKERCSTRS